MTAKKKEKKIDVTFAAGWLQGQEVTEDDSEGERNLIAGLKTRIRLSSIYAYQTVEPGILALFVTGVKDNLFMVGSLEALDKIMSRNNLKEVEKSC